MKEKLPPGDISERNRALVAMLPWKIVKIRDLPEHFHKAIVAHGIWPRKVRKFSEAQPSKFIMSIMDKGKKIGLCEIPMDFLRIQIMSDPDRTKNFYTFKDYHRHYCKNEKDRVKNHGKKNRWPIILSGRGRNRETILDGWHRMHSYHRAGFKTVSAIWYADE